MTKHYVLNCIGVELEVSSSDRMVIENELGYCPQCGELCYINSEKFADVRSPRFNPSYADSFSDETDKGYALPNEGGQVVLNTHYDHDEMIGRGIGVKTVTHSRQEEQERNGMSDRMRELMGWKKGGKRSKERKATEKPNKIVETKTYKSMFQTIAYRMGFAGMPLNGKLFKQALEELNGNRDELMSEYNAGKESGTAIARMIEEEVHSV